MEESRRAVSVRQLEEELQRERRRTKRRKRRRIALVCLLVLLILLIVLGSGFSTVLRISGDAMAGTLRDGDIAVGLKSSHYRSGDVVVFRFNSGVLVKRLLAQVARIDRMGQFQDAVGKCSLPMIDVGNNAKIPNFIHTHTL